MLEPVRRGTWLLSLLVTLALVRSAFGDPAPKAPAPACDGGRPRYGVGALVDVAAHVLNGQVRIDAQNRTTMSLRHIDLWLYPNRFIKPPPLNDIEYYWVYPLSFDPGSITLESLSIDGAPVDLGRLEYPDGPFAAKSLARIALARPIAPGQPFVVEARFRIKIPNRYGLFGVISETLGPGPIVTLAGGFFPFLPEMNATGFDLTAPPAASLHDLTLDVPANSHVVLAGEYLPPPFVAPPG